MCSLLKNFRGTKKIFSVIRVPIRNLNLLEYQSKHLLRGNGVAVQEFCMVDQFSDKELADFSAQEYVIKAQILAGGRGKGHFSNGFKGGVQITKNRDDIIPIVQKMLGHKLITKQTPQDGIEVKKVMIAESVDIIRETYVCVLMDRQRNGPVFIVSPAGGMDIEGVAEKTPHLIKTVPVDIKEGVTDEMANDMADFLEFKPDMREKAANEIKKLWELFLKVDAVQIEINPLAETSDKKVISVDAKLNFDDNAKFRQKNIFEMEDSSESDPREVEAAKYNLNYIGMEGNIGCLVNGAGLAMATMDIIKLYGGDPANFLDVGGSVKEDQVKKAFEILTQDIKVKGILVNVFGGIVNCATIANGIVSACKSMELKIPLVVRLEGTNVTEAKNIIKKSGLPILAADHLDDAANKVVNSVKYALICLNGGICLEGPGVTFSCKCQTGWTGYLCDVEIDECMSNPCQNGAVCLDLHAEYACACLFGFTGTNCELLVQVCEENTCENNALCLVEDDHVICYCVPDYHGDKCQFQYDECQLGPRCMNGGTCIDGIDNFTCSCAPNLTGLLCECLVVSPEEQLLDCSYVAPTTIFNNFTTMISTEPTTIIVSTIESVTELSTVQETTLITTTEVPNFNTTEFIETTSFNNISTHIANLTTLEIITESPTTILPFTSPSTIFGVSTTTESIVITEPVTILTTEVITVTSSITKPTESTSTLLTDATTLPISETTVEVTTIDGLSEKTTLISPTIHIIEESTTSRVEVTTEERTTMEGTTTVPIEISTSSKSGRDMDNVTIIPIFFTTTPSSTYVTEITTLTPDETLISTTTVTSFSPDCNRVNNTCRNGGTCIININGNKCFCTFDTFGPRCEHKLGIRNAAFGGNSFLAHRLHNKSNIEIEFISKTASMNGLLFYSNLDHAYMALFIEHGYLKFKFSCGYQTMLLSELGKAVTNGYDMKVVTTLNFNKDFTQCNAMIKLNNTLTMTGSQIALIDRFSKVPSWLYLGGVPNEYVKDQIHPGLIGCMSKLKISGRSIEIFQAAEDGSEITECSSLACLSGPCQNNGYCSSSGEDYNCLCKNGFSGKFCETSVCEDNPCQYGGTCLPYTGSGYICLCPIGKHGHFCENELLISKPYFSSSLHGYSSYIAHEIPRGKFNTMEIKFKFLPTTLDQIALLMFLGQKERHDFYSDHIAVSFVKGFIMLTWNLGSGPRRIFTTKSISSLKTSHTIHIGRTGRRAWLYVENLGNITGRSPGNMVHLDVAPYLYFGGYEVQNFSTLPHDLPLHSGFSGCIYDMEFKAGDISIPIMINSRTYGRALGQCGATECYEDICHNGGACLHHGGTYTCLCQDSYYGPLCSSRNNLCDSFRNNCSSGSTCVPLVAGYECDCPIGKTGAYCHQDVTLSDIYFTGIRSYLSVSPQQFELIKFNIDFEIRPLENKGVVLFIGQKETFLAVSIQSGLLELKLMPSRKRIESNELLSVRSNKLLVLGNWHTVRIGLYGRKVYVFVNNIVNTGILQSGEVLSLNDQDIFIGGLPSLSDLPNEAASFLPIPFKGCFRKLIINNLHLPLNENTIKSSRNIADCDGTPCGGDYCENSGTCWLDPNLKPHCSCPDPFFGDKCEKVPTCGENICYNQGRCVQGKCVCSVGWYGGFCEASIIVRTPKFEGASYLILNKSVKKRNANSVKEMVVNFTTTVEDGLLLWAQKNGSFFGVGLEQGYLKLAYTSKELQKTLEIPDFNKLSDGLVHSLSINYNPLNLKVDDNDILLQSRDDIDFTNHDVFLGGIPPEFSGYKEAKNLFHSNFEGCVHFLSTNDLSVTNFMEFEGEDVTNCNVV